MFFRPETESKFARAQDSNICKADIRVTKQGSRTPKNRFAPKLRHDAGASSGSDDSANSESSESESGSDSDSDTEESDTDQATGSGAESGSDHDARHEAYAQGQSLRVLGTCSSASVSLVLSHGCRPCRY